MGDCDFTLDGETRKEDELKKYILSNRELFKKYVSGVNFVPDAPFKTTWVELAAKRAVRYAAEHGYDRLAWTTGEIQNQRYDLSKQVDRIEWKHDGTEYALTIYPKGLGARDAINRHEDTEEGLAEVIGKELAEKIVADRASGKAQGAFVGLDLKVGGKGMVGFYDHILPTFLNKFSKPFGGKVGETKIDASGDDAGHYEGPQYSTPQAVGQQYMESPHATKSQSAVAAQVMQAMGHGQSFQSAMNKYATDAFARTMGGKLVGEPVTVHALSITEAMRASALQGLPLFAKDGQSEGILRDAKAQHSILVKTYADMPSFPLTGRSDAAFLDAGSRLTKGEKTQILDNPDVQAATKVILDVLDDVIARVLGKSAEHIERTGLILDDHTYGVFLPKPGTLGGQRKAMIFLNPFEHMLGGETPVQAAHLTYLTAVHEALHWDIPNDTEAFTRALEAKLEALGPDYAAHTTTRILRAYEDPKIKGAYRPGLREVLPVYGASRRRPERLADAVSVAGRRATRPPDQPGAARGSPEDVRRGRERTVTRDELKKLAQRRGTSIAEERERAVTAGFTVKDEGLLEPAVQKLSEAATSERNLVLGVLSPGKVGVAPIAAGSIRAHTAANDQRRARANKTLEQYARKADTWSDEQGHQFIDVMQGLEAIESLPKEWQAVATALRTVIQDWTNLLLKHDLLTNYLEHYWPQEWKQQSLEGKTLQKLFGRKPVQGPESYRKQRTIPTNRQGRAFGLVEAEPNPFRQLQRKIFEMSQSVKGRDLHADLIQHGLYAYVPATKAKPAEIAHWQRVPDYALGTKYGPTPTSGPSGRLVMGHYYAPPEVVRLIENHLSPGLWGKSVLYDAYKTIGNVSTQILLGWSSFHAWLTGLESVISKQSVALEALARGDLRLAGKYQSQVGPQGVIRDLIRGYKAIHTFYSRDAEANDVTGLIGQIVQAGGGFGWSDFEHEDAPAKFMRDLRGLMGAVQRGEPGRAAAKGGKAAVHGVMAAFELPTALIMNHWVPYLKVSAFLDMAELEMRRIGPGATMADLRQVLGDAWDTVDDRFGQLRYDNLFWNNSFKQILTGGFLSVGWQVGSLRGGLGALGQIPRTVRKLKGDTAIPMGPKGKGSGGEPRFERVSEPWLQRNVAWLFSLAVIVGLAGAIYQKIKTGKNPESRKDLFYPRNGEIGPSGNEERDAPISYWKDYYAWTHHPVTTLEHKLKPALNMIWEAVNNEDFYGDAIRDENDPVMQQLWDTVKAEALRSIPIASGNALRRAGADASKMDWLKAWLKINAIPFTPASAELERSDAENYLHGLIPPSHRTKDQAALAASRRQLRADVEAKKPEAIAEARKAGLTPASIRATLRSERLGSLKAGFDRTTWAQAVKAYGLATPEERTVLKPVLLRKFGRAMATAGSPDARTRVIQQRDAAARLKLASDQ